MAKNDRLCIKINEHLTIAAKDIRNIEVRTKVPKADDPKMTISKVGYVSNLKAALMLCAREVPLVTNAKNLDQLNSDYNSFIKSVESIVDQYKLPDSKQLLGDSEESPVGLYGKDFRKPEPELPDDEFSSDDDEFDDEFGSEDEWG